MLYVPKGRGDGGAHFVALQYHLYFVEPDIQHLWYKLGNAANVTNVYLHRGVKQQKKKRRKKHEQQHLIAYFGWCGDEEIRRLLKVKIQVYTEMENDVLF